VTELADIVLKRHAVLQAHRNARAEGVHQATYRAAFLGHREEQLARAAVGVEADGDVALVAGDAELVGDAVPRIGQAFAARLLHGGRGGAVALGARGKGLAFLGAVAVDRQGLEAELPAVEVGLGDVLGRRVARHVHRL
jgi:hypothetical protein